MEILPSNISKGSFTNIFHISTSPVVTVHNIKMHSAGRKRNGFLACHYYDCINDTVSVMTLSFLYLYTILTDMQKLDMNYSQCVPNMRHYRFRYSPRNRSVDIYGTWRYIMKHRGDGGAATDPTYRFTLSV